MAFKAGDKAVVTINYVVDKEAKCNVMTGWIELSDLQPLPAPLTELERAVVEAADKCVTFDGIAIGGFANILTIAVQNLRVARKPADPIDAMIKAASQVLRSGVYVTCGELADLNAAIAAVEASRKP